MNWHFQIAQTLTKLLDTQFGLGRFRFGLDPLLGLIPGLGDAVSLLVSIYIVWIAVELRLPQERISRMLSNVFVDFILGLVPVVGDISDFAFKANSRNLEILKDYAPGRLFEGEIYS